MIGCISLKDPLRSDAKLAIRELQRMGKDVRLCTGADLATAKGYAKELGIQENKIFANCIGVTQQNNHCSKIHYIEQLQAEGKRVAMVGDAANDTVAIVKSDFGIAIKSNSGDVMTQDTADAVVDKASLMPVVTAFAVAKETVKCIKQNLIMSLAYNTTMLLIAGGVLVAVGFALNPGIGVALMILQTSLVLLNQYRIKRKSLPHLEKQTLIKPEINGTPEMSYQHFQRLGIQSLSKRSIPTPWVENPSKQQKKECGLVQRPYCRSEPLLNVPIDNLIKPAFRS